MNSRFSQWSETAMGLVGICAGILGAHQICKQPGRIIIVMCQDLHTTMIQNYSE